MKIIIISNGTGGLYGFRKELIASLLNKNEVTLVSRVSEYKEELLEMGCELIPTNFNRRGQNPFKEIILLTKYFKILKHEKPDLVITYTIKPNIYGGMVCRLLKIPYVVNITGLGSVFQREGFKLHIISKIYRVSLKKAKVVFFENSGNQKVFLDKKIVKINKTCVLNGAGVNLEHFQYLEYPLDSNVFKFLFIGRVMKEKGIDELFDAMKKLVNMGMNCHLDILGGLEENYKKTIDNYENEGWLHYHGYQSDIRPYINECHCFVLPSWHEGMANTNLESAACGRPIITSNISGCKEAVIDGKTGFLCKPQDVDSLYQSMLKMCKLSYDIRKNMGKEGRTHMKNIFDKRKVVEETIKAMMK